LSAIDIRNSLANWIGKRAEVREKKEGARRRVAVSVVAILAIGMSEKEEGRRKSFCPLPSYLCFLT
jgi:hypothetical protein